MTSRFATLRGRWPFAWMALLSAVWVSVVAAAGAPRVEGAALEGYLTRADGSVVMNSFGECWHTSWWDTRHSVPGCDGVVVGAAGEPAPSTPPATVRRPDPVGDAVYFEFDRYDLDEQDRAAIAALVRRMPPNGYLTVAGHSDRIGTDEHNQALSQLRADAVRDYLVRTFGFDPVRIQVSAFGETRPRVECAADLAWDALVDCFQPNRRAEVAVVTF